MNASSPESDQSSSSVCNNASFHHAQDNTAALTARSTGAWVSSSPQQLSNFSLEAPSGTAANSSSFALESLSATLNMSRTLGISSALLMRSLTQRIHSCNFAR